MISTRLARHPRLKPLVLAACLPLWCGCGTEEYDQRMTKTMAIYRLKGKFVDLTPTPVAIVDPTKGVGVNASMRIPMAFVGIKPVNEKSADPNTKNIPGATDIIPHDRVQPPCLDIPGFQMTYEQLVGSSAGQRIMSMYFGVAPADPEYLDKIPAEIKSKMKLSTDVAWKDEMVLRPDGTTVPWKTIAVQGIQGFHWTNSGLSRPEDLEGTFVLWVHEAQKHFVFVAYRFPTSSQGSAPAAKGLPDAVRNALGTLQVVAAAGAAPPARP